MVNLRSSLLITFFASNGATAVHLAVTIVLARLLSPSEVGIFSITAVLVSIAHIFRDFGVASYLQREETLTKDKVGAAFGVLLASSWSIALVIFLLAPAAASFYKQSGVKDVMQVLALGFVFIPFGSITNTLLTRDYRAKEQAYVSAVGTVVYASTAIGLAYMGHSYMSMAWANLANIIVAAIAFAPFRPAIAPLLPRFKGWRKVVNFGSGAVLGNSLTMVNNAIPDLVLGKISGTHEVGIMSRSLSTTSMFSQLLGPTVNYAALPYLSRVHHANQPLQEPMARAVAYVTGVMWPALALIYVHAESIILVLYGAKWIECVPIVQILCLVAIATTPFSFTNAAYMAIGRPHLTSVPVLMLILLKALMIYLLFDGSLASFAYALAGATFLSYPMQAIMQKKYLGIHTKPFLVAQWRSLIVTAACLATSLPWLSFSEVWARPIVLVAVGGTATISWIVALALTQHPLLEEMQRFLRRKQNGHQAL